MNRSIQFTPLSKGATMDPIDNPFSPGAGSPPPALAGRDEIMEQANVLLRRILAHRPEKSLMLTGLRGVGKTVLLNEIEKMARSLEYRTLLVEAHQDKAMAALLAPHLRSLFYDLDRMAGAGNKVRRGLTVLKSFISAIEIKIGDINLGLDIAPESGTADSGDLEVDLPILFVALGEAALERGTAVALFIDEIQYFNQKELSALIMAMHKMQQRGLPVVLIAAGLPILPGLAGESKSYAERLFSFPNVGALPEVDAKKALQDPVTRAGIIFDELSLKEIFRQTQGYPYFLQEWGYQAWNHAENSPIELAIVQQSSEIVSKRLDENFFRVRFDRLTPQEKHYLRAMAELGEGPYRTNDIAAKLGRPMSKLGPRRASLIKKGMIYSLSYGSMDFTVPLFGNFIRRAIPEFTHANDKTPKRSTRLAAATTQVVTEDSELLDRLSK